MTDDLPDYTKDVHLTVMVEDTDPAEVTVIQPDETKLLATVTQAAKDRTITGTVGVIAHPTGEIETKGAGVLTVLAAETVIAEREITDGKEYHLAFVNVAPVNDHWIYVFTEGVKRATYYAHGSFPFIFWYPWGWNKITGDASKKLEVKAMAVATGETLLADFAGEEV